MGRNGRFINALGAVVKNSVRMEADHFRLDLSREETQRLFGNHVELIEVETTSYCNRTCSFCPNNFIDRHSKELPMPEHSWQAILEGLSEVDYEGTFVWSRYSEPLSERRIVDRIREVREAAPRSRICINSNGDYLDADYLSELERTGLDRLWIDLYIPDDEGYDLEVATNYYNKFLKRIERTGTVTATHPELACRISSPQLGIVSHVRNVTVMKAMDMSDRGGLVQIARETSRVAPSYRPQKHLVIDWVGSIVVCCQLRSDSPTHKTAVVGKIGVDGVGLTDAYVRLAKWREGLRSYGPKPGACSACNVSEYESNRFTRVLSRFLGDTASATSGFFRTALRPLTGKKQRY